MRSHIIYKFLFLSFLFCLFAGVASATDINIAKSGSTITASYVGGGSIASGTNAATVIQSAFDAATSGTTINFDSSTYSITAMCQLESTDATVKFNSATFNINTGDDAPGFKFLGTNIKDTTLSSNSLAGSSTLTLSSASGVVVGDLIRVYNNIQWNPDEYPEAVQGETHLITNVNGNTITLNDPLLNDYRTSTASHVEVYTAPSVTVDGGRFIGIGMYDYVCGLKFINVKNSVIKNGYYTENGCYNTGVYTSFNVSVFNNTLLNADETVPDGLGYGTLFGDACSNVTFRDNFCQQCRHAVTLSFSDYIGQNRNCYILNNTIYSGKDAAIDSHAVTVNMEVRNNTIHCYSALDGYQHAFDDGSKNSIFANNRVYDAINIAVFRRGMYPGNDVKIITDNVFTNSVMIDEEGTKIWDLRILNNTINAVNASNVIYFNGFTSNNLLIQNNTINYGLNGIYIDQNSISNVLIQSNNISYTRARGIYINTMSNNLHIINNRIRDCSKEAIEYSGIQLNAVTNAFIQSNVISDTLARMGYGILATSSDYNTYTDNNVITMRDGDLSISGTHNTLRNNGYAYVDSKITPTITWSNPANINYNTLLSSTQLNAVGSVPGTVTYPLNPIGTRLGAGTKTLSCTFTPTDQTTYNIAYATVTINVLQLPTTITWSNPANITYGTALSGTQLNAVGSVPGTVTYPLNPIGTVLGAGTRTISCTFTPTDSTNYSASTGSVSINVSKVTPVITWSNPANINYGTALSGTQLNAACATTAGTFVYNPTSGTVLPVGSNTLGTTFTPTDTTNYNTATKSVTVNVVDQIPVANFTSNNTGGGVGTVIQFNNSSSNFPDSYSWNFGDGTTSSSENPTHQFTTCGAFTVSFTASNTAGSNTITKTSLITINPVANFTGNPLTGPYPLTVTFSSNSLGNSLTYQWSFGDGTANSTVQNPVHSYSANGTYNVSLTVISGGISNTLTRSNYITAGTPTPVAAFTGSPTSGIAPLSATFTDQSTGNPTSWSWSFGDGTANSTTRNPVHSYTTAGSYTVILTASNIAGNNSLTKSNYITVSSGVIAPIASFSGIPTIGLPGTSVKFTDSSVNSPNNWSWNFGDGAFSYSQSPNHVYSSVGVYNVNLTVRNSAGSNSMLKVAYINITNSLTPPVTLFRANDTFDAIPMAVAFTDQSTGSPTAWNYSFGDGSYNTSQNPVHTYSNAGSYTVSLNASNVAGYRINKKLSYIEARDTSKYSTWQWLFMKTFHWGG